LGIASKSEGAEKGSAPDGFGDEKLTSKGRRK